MGSLAIVAGSAAHRCGCQKGRSYEFVFKLRPLAEQHAKVSGHKVRLVRFRRDQMLEDISP
jgi:hypothetical protein